MTTYREMENINGSDSYNDNGSSFRRSLRNREKGTEAEKNAQNNNTDENGDDEYGFLDYRNVSRIRLGRFEFDTWYGNSALFKEPIYNKTRKCLYTELAFKDHDSFSDPPLNKKFATVHMGNTPDDHLKQIQDKKPWIDILFVCPFCFKFTDKEIEWEQHINCCQFRSKLPGKVMYNDGEFVIRKVKGAYHKLFCQCMCLLAKFFLDNKSIFYHLDYFDFYVIYQKLDRHEVPMGFYSRELLSWESNNLSCICVLPCYQKRQLGTKLIDFSYKLSSYEQQISGPERPLSPLGKMAYLSYWCRCISLSFVYGPLSTKKHVTLQMISELTGFRIDDILLSFSFMDVLYDNGLKNPNMDYYLEEYKYSDHCIFVQDEKYRVFIDKLKIKKWIINNKVSNQPILNSECLVLY